MINVKRIGLVTLLPLTLCVTLGCNKSNKIETTIKEVSDRAFGNVNFNLTQKDFENAGFNYDDLMEFTVHDYPTEGEQLTFEAAFVKNYNEVGYFAPCLCNYGGTNERPEISFGILPQKDEGDALVNKKVTIKMKEKQGYHKTRELVDVATKLTYEELGKDNLAYANFRDVTSVGTISKYILANKAFRGSSPFNAKGNPNERDYIADAYLDVYGIKSEISLANTDAEIENFMKEVALKRESYSHELYRETKEESAKSFFAVGLGGDYFTTGKGKDGDYVKDVFKYIAERCDEGPIYFHCNEGKDRTGFVAMVIEALMGCSLDDLVADAMLTFKNYYNVSVVNNKEKYDALANLLIYRHIYSILLEDPVKELPKINWYEFDAKAAVEKKVGSYGHVLSSCAERYLKIIGVTDTEIDSIVNWLDVPSA